MRHMVFVAIVAMALSGCASPAEIQNDDGSLLVASADGAGDVGDIRGRIFADYGGAIAGAHVSPLGTTSFTKTEQDGGFEIVGVPTGTYRLRIDAVRFMPEERSVEVSTDQAREVEIVLGLANPTVGGMPHVHDYWGNAQEVLIAKATTYWNNHNNNDLMIRFFEGANPVHGTHRLNNNQSATDNDYRIRIPMGDFAETEGGDRPALVYPGTERIEIKVVWDGQLTNVHQIGVGALRPEADMEEAMLHPPIDNGGTAVFEIPANWTDSGHQLWSRWFFFLYNSNAMSNDGWQPQYSYDEAFTSAITVFKGDGVPFEPPHRDWWADGNLIQYEVEDYQNIDNTNAVDWRSPNSGHLFLHKSEMIPPGTERMEVRFQWDYANRLDDGDAATDRPHTLTMRMADQNPYTTDLADYRRFEGVSCGSRCIDYVIDLESGWTDQFYQTRSGWAFLATVAGQEDERNYSLDPNTEKWFHLGINLDGPDLEA